MAAHAKSALTLLWLSAFLLTGSMAREPVSLPSQSRQETAEPRGADRIGERGEGKYDGLRVIRQETQNELCGLEAATLIVLDRRREITRYNYCSAYGRGGASVVTDASGGNYVLLEYAEGHGTHATTDWLMVFRLTDGFLMERANFIIREPIAVIADHVYDFRAETPPGGGLILNGAWIVDDRGIDDDNIDVPERSRTIVAIDTHEIAP